jgi:hypothetical protein
MDGDVPMLESNRIVQSLWVGKLTSMEQLSIKSHIAHGHEFHLYTYGKLEGVPEGTIVKDANEIVPEEMIAKFQNLANFSDYFRFSLIYKKGGWWTDTDSVCLKPFDFEQEYVFPNYTSNTVSPGVFKAPAGCKILAWCLEQQKKLNWKTCAWADLGPFMLFKAVNHFNMRKFCLEQDTFLPPMSIPEDLVSIIPPRIFGEGTYAVHLHNEMWRSQHYDKDGAYPPTSIYGQLKVRYLRSQPISENPKVSIIISCYNYGKYLAQAIDSALAQTHTNVEVIVVDDGSTDNSLEIARSYGDRITALTQPNSGSPTFARNKGLENSTGELVISLDADDWLQPNFIERTLPHMKAGIGAVSVLLVGMTGKDSKPTLRQMTEGNQCAQTALMRRQAVLDAGGWIDTGYEDWNLWISMMEAGWEIYTVGEGLYNYRRHGNEGRYLEKLHPNHAGLVVEIRNLHPELYKALALKPLWPRTVHQHVPLYVHTPDPSGAQHVPPALNPLYNHTPDPSQTRIEVPPPEHKPLVQPLHYTGYYAPKRSDGKQPLYVHTPDPSK